MKETYKLLCSCFKSKYLCFEGESNSFRALSIDRDGDSLANTEKENILAIIK